jgi:hypothetical protein
MKKATATGAAEKTASSPAKADAVSLLKADHRKVEQIFAQYEQTEDEDQKAKLAHQVCIELIVHTKLEEEIFYPACREKQVDDDLLNEAQVEHDGAKVLIADLLQGSPSDEYYDAKVKTLSEYITHHVGEEEKARSGIFAKAQKAGVDMVGLGQKIQARKQELMAQSEALGSRPPKPRSFRLQPQVQESPSMARYSQERDRDERGRFTDDDDRRGGSRGGRGGQERDEYGRFASDDDDRRGGSRSSSGGGDRGGHGGWFGDSEGHSRASERGWEERGSSRSSRGRYDDEDDRRGSSGSGRGHGGWFGDPEGHSRASERGWEERGSSRSSRSQYDDDDRRSSGGRGHGGWFGDPEGHSEAAEKGWEERGSSRSSRGRDDDDDRRGGSRGGSGGGRGGHGGWFGDSEGHSEASRRGWRDR